MLSTLTNHIIFENKYTEIKISKADSSVIDVIDKISSKSIKGDSCNFFSLMLPDKETVVAPSSLECEGDTITVKTAIGDFKVKVATFEDFFTFELVTELPKDSFLARIANVKYSYDYTDKNNVGACGIAMTYWANPCFFPDSKDLETKAEVVRHLKDIGAKYALIVAPINSQRDIIKKVFAEIDPEKGLVSDKGGPYGRDSRLSFSNYIMAIDMNDQFLADNIEIIKSLNVDQVDVHKSTETTFSTGDFVYAAYKDGADFKKRVTDVLKENGIDTGLHTYAYFLDMGSNSILSDPKWQKDLEVKESFTLAENVSADNLFIPTVEDTNDVSLDFGFLRYNSPLLLIDEELMQFENTEHGFVLKSRGFAGTKAVEHKKGATVHHISGCFYCIAPKIGSELFYQIARNTAKAYNEGGYTMLYVDALDGLWLSGVDREYETWFYAAAFTHEIIKNCNTYPLIEFAQFRPCLWNARGRVGAWDFPFREYKAWTNFHGDTVGAFMDSHLACTLGWYNFYPLNDKYPGNECAKYHHTDAVHYMGSYALSRDYGIVYAERTLGDYRKIAGLRRNIAIYTMYDKLRKEQYFSPETLAKVRESKYECHVTEKEAGKFKFVEKDYKIKKLQNLSDDNRNYGIYSNPFKAQSPFVRIEAFLSTTGNNPITLLPLDKTKDLTTQVLSRDFGGEIDLSEHIAKKVTVTGNGKKGGTIAVMMSCGTSSEVGYSIYTIDTDFEGEREFLLIESENAERLELGFEDEYTRYPRYRAPYRHERATGIKVKTVGDMTGVKMSDIVAVNHTYEVLKNPTVKIGDQSLTFNCELMSTDFIEFDGECAKVIDRYGNEKTVDFSGNLIAPTGEFKAELKATALNRSTPRAQLTFGFTGNEIE